MRFIASLLTAVLLISCPMAAFAKDTYPDFTVSGFASLAATGTDTDRLGYRRDTEQTSGVTNGWGFDTNSNLGLQLDVEINNSWHAGVQWIARNHAGDFFEQNLDWAYLRWQPVDDLSIRAGRLGLDIFMLSDYRNVGYAYPWMSPPHEFYAGIPAYHFDGADVTKKFAIGEGTMTLKAFGGRTFVQTPPGIDFDMSLAGGKLSYEYGHWNALISYAHVQDNYEMPPLQPLLAALNSAPINAVWPGAQSLVQQVAAKDKVLHYSSIGLAYDDGIWLAQMEAAYINSELSTYHSVANGYLSAGRRFGKVTLYSLFGISETLNSRVKLSNPLAPVPAVIGLRNAVDQLLNTNGVDEKSVSLGLRWDIYKNIAVKTQWSHYWLGNNGAALLWLDPAPGPTPDTVNVWSVGMDLVF